MPNLKEFFDLIDLDMSKRFKDERRQEGLYLEFKTLADDQTFGRDDRKNLAEAVAGFLSG